ncbi:hypothetical protein CsSME_00004682 [Camellia sinensis var. sinensis]
MDANSDEEDGDEAEEDDGVNQYGHPASLHVIEFHHSTFTGELEQQSRRQHHKQHHPYHHRSPIPRPHLSLSLLTDDDDDIFLSKIPPTLQKKRRSELVRWIIIANR